ncbi:epidermal retinol dehydrogenase 2-like [Mytilus galloprovincialis]|uniref:epidermal retinol dehydrogenase 2-like n=1 Tax=Mytilus galloprovincialis TaxID=29158 RepID=UPI003F7C9B6A
MVLPDAEDNGALSKEGVLKKETKMSIFIDCIEALKAFLVAYMTSIWRFFVSPPNKSVTGEIVLITGSGSGIGRQLALEFGKLGAVLVLWDIDDKANEETGNLMKKFDAKFHLYKCDVGIKDEVKKVGRRVKEEVGDVAILINNAGIVSGTKLINTPDDMIEKVFRVNLLAHYWTVKFFMPTMIRKNHGHIVNIASSTGLVGINKLTEYCASKFGVVGFTEVLSYELIFGGHDGVHTTLVCPSYVETGMFEGCKMRFPWILPPLKVSYTVEKIMQAILTNQQMICIPRSIYFFTFLKTILPVEAFHEIIKLFGAANFMDSFIGRHNSETEEKTNGFHNGHDTVKT